LVKNENSGCGTFVSNMEVKKKGGEVRGVRRGGRTEESLPHT